MALHNTLVKKKYNGKTEPRDKDSQNFTKKINLTNRKQKELLVFRCEIATYEDLDKWQTEDNTEYTQKIKR